MQDVRKIDWLCFFFQAEDGIRDLVRSRGLGDVYKRQARPRAQQGRAEAPFAGDQHGRPPGGVEDRAACGLSLIHI